MVTEKFEEMEKRLSEMDDSMRRLEERFDALSSKVDEEGQTKVRLRRVS